MLAVKLAGGAAFVLIGGYAGVTAWKLLTGGISMRGLLRVSHLAGPPKYSAMRLQMLIATVLVGAEYLSAVWHNPHSGALPVVPAAWVAILAGSNCLYLGAKALNLYRPLLRKPR